MTKRGGGYLAIGTGVVLAGVLAAAGLPHLRAAAAGSPPASITVTGEGQVTASAATASFQTGVRVQGATAAQALSSADASMTRIVAALEGQGLPADHLQTTDVSVDPEYTSQGTLRDFIATESLQVKLDTLSAAGADLDAAVAAGANTVSQLQFSPADPQALRAAALNAALADARASASALASGAHLTLGPVTKMVSESVSVPQPIFAGAMAASVAVTPVLGGQQEVSAQVTVTFVAS